MKKKKSLQRKEKKLKRKRKKHKRETMKGSPSLEVKRFFFFFLIEGHTFLSNFRLLFFSYISDSA